jgi:uncharacterized protein YegL
MKSRVTPYLAGLIAAVGIILGQQGCTAAPPEKAAEAQKKPSPEKQEERSWPFVKDDEPAAQELATKLTAKNYVLIFDGSGSMAEKGCSGNRPKIDVAKEAVTEWFGSVQGDANVGLVAFHQGGWTKLPLTPRKNANFANKLKALSPGGNTPLDNAMAEAYDMLTRQARSQIGYGDYLVVVVTDGIATRPQELAQIVDKVLASTPIVIHTIGFCIKDKHTLNQQGRTIYRAADNPAELRKGLQEVLAEAEKFDAAKFSK